MEAIWVAIGLVVGGVVSTVLVRGICGQQGARLEAELRAAAEQRASEGETRAALLTELKAICGDALKGQSGELVTLARAEFKSARAEANADLESRQRAVEE